MAEKEHSNAEGQYKQVNPSGLAAEIASGSAGRTGDAAALGEWLGGRLDAAGVPPERLAALSGLDLGDLARLLEGQAAFPLDADHLQRLATALIELQVISDPAPLWEAAGFADSEYIVPPTRVVQSMSGTV